MKNQKEITDKIIDGIIEEIRGQQDKREKYVKSGRADRAIDLLKVHIANTKNESERGYIYNESIRYHPEKNPMLEEDFSELVSSVLDFAKLDRTIEEKHNPFPHKVFEYRGMIFRIMHGQGTAIQMWDKSIYEEWQKGMPEKMKKIKEECGPMEPWED